MHILTLENFIRACIFFITSGFICTGHYQPLVTSLSLYGSPSACMSLSLFLSVSPSTCPSLPSLSSFSPCVCLSVCPSVCPSLSLSLSLSIGSPSACLSVSPSVSLSACLALLFSLSKFLSLHSLSACLSVPLSLSRSLPVYPSASPSLSRSPISLFLFLIRPSRFLQLSLSNFPLSLSPPFHSLSKEAE